jgi:hypothetical protein
MAEKYVMKQNDLEPSLELQLLDGSTPIDLTSVVDVLFLMKARRALKATGSMTVADQTILGNTGIVRYDWTQGDTDTVGQFNAEVQVIWPGLRPQTFPANSYITVDIQKDLGPVPVAFGSLTLNGGGALEATGVVVSGIS